MLASTTNEFQPNKYKALSVRLQKAMTNISAIDPVTFYFLILQLCRSANNLSLNTHILMKNCNLSSPLDVPQYKTVKAIKHIKQSSIKYKIKATVAILTPS